MGHGWFRKRKTPPPAGGAGGLSDVPEGLWTPCPRCRELLFTREWERQLKVCSRCGHHARLTARERIELLIDDETFVECDAGLLSANPLDFPGYEAKLEEHRRRNQMEDAILSGYGRIDGRPVNIAVTDFHFMGGSMGSVVGERITRTVERAFRDRQPVVLVSGTGGGVRQQEGLIGLMQMAKTSGALARHHEAGLLAIVLLTDPSLAGVMASWGSLGDFNLAEPGAKIGFAGERVAQQAQVSKVPTDFQTAEFQLGRGQLDKVVQRKDLKRTLGLLLEFAGTPGDEECTERSASGV